MTKVFKTKKNMFRFCCHPATNLLKHLYLGTFLMGAGWQQIPIYGIKQQNNEGNWWIFMGF
jgi:hypothetical protein